MSTPAQDPATGTAATGTHYSDDLSLALNLANAADDLTMDRFEAGDLQIETKPDLTPVSDADTATESRLRELLSTHRPDDAVLGEEFGGDVTLTGRQWVIDPIDGTKNFVRGVPVWATLISLLVDGKPVVGVVSAPGLARRWWAAEGMGAWRTFGADQARRMSVSGVSDVADSSISLSSLDGWRTVGRRDQLVAHRFRRRLRAWRLLVLLHGRRGHCGRAAEPEVSLWTSPLSTSSSARPVAPSPLDGTLGPHEASARPTACRRTPCPHWNPGNHPEINWIRVLPQTLSLVL